MHDMPEFEIQNHASTTLHIDYDIAESTLSHIRYSYTNPIVY